MANLEQEHDVEDFATMDEAKMNLVESTKKKEGRRGRVF
jgi:hypothetical protein